MADFSLQSKVADEENVKRRKAQPVNEFFKIAICKHWEKMGSCPFNDECHFAHGDKELRPFPKGEKDPREARMGGGGAGKSGGDHGPRGGGPPPGAAFGANNNSNNERSQPPPVVLPDENKLCKYFLLQSQSYHNLAHSVHFSQWSASKEIQQQLKMASETADEVFLLITVGPSKHFQGVARLASSAMVNAGAEEGEDLSAGVVPYQSEGKTQWSGAFGIEWLRICECPWERLQQFENKQLPVPEWYVCHPLCDVNMCCFKEINQRFNQPSVSSLQSKWPGTGRRHGPFARATALQSGADSAQLQVRGRRAAATRWCGGTRRSPT